MNPKALISVIKAHGLKYFIFRSSYELKRKSGILKYSFPKVYKKIDSLTLEEFQNSNFFFFHSRESITLVKDPNELLKERACNILEGKILFFSNLLFDLGSEYDWVTNPDSQYRYNIKEHWTEIEDINEKAGDIKFVWEKSRFSYIYNILRFDYHFDEDHSSWVFDEICDWIDKNPLNYGVNYKCSQEISIRVLNWIFVLNFYKYSSHLTEQTFDKIINSIYGQIKHIEKNINFSRICVRNNHAITETLTLYLTSLLLPSLPGAEKRKLVGKKYFEQEVDFQIANDGTFIQESMNYHRVVIQLLTWAISISDINGENFSSFVYEKAYLSLNFLFQCQEQSTGKLPNYGANDGALFFPLNNNDYRDYRPQLDALHILLTGESLYRDLFEDIYYYSANQTFNHGYSPLSLKYGTVNFEDSGYYLFRDHNLFTLFRCGSYNGVGGTNDQMHLDLWYNGKNILCDSGSYKYNTSQDLIKYFSGTESQNCVMLEDNHLQKKGIRFIWNNPPIKQFTNISFSNGIYKIEASSKCFRYIDPEIVWNRSVEINSSERTIIVKDNIDRKTRCLMLRQLWHTPINSSIHFISTGNIKTSIGKESNYYGSYVENQQIEFLTNDNFVTTIIQF